MARKVQNQTFSFDFSMYDDVPSPSYSITEKWENM